jgi:hypothetical protein
VAETDVCPVGELLLRRIHDPLRAVTEDQCTVADPVIGILDAIDVQELDSLCLFYIKWARWQSPYAIADANREHLASPIIELF